MVCPPPPPAPPCPSGAEVLKGDLGGMKSQAFDQLQVQIKLRDTTGRPGPAHRHSTHTAVAPEMLPAPTRRQHCRALPSAPARPPPGGRASAGEGAAHTRRERAAGSEWRRAPQSRPRGRGSAPSPRRRRAVPGTGTAPPARGRARAPAGPGAAPRHRRPRARPCSWAAGRSSQGAPTWAGPTAARSRTAAASATFRLRWTRGRTGRRPPAAAAGGGCLPLGPEVKVNVKGTYPTKSPHLEPPPTDPAGPPLASPSQPLRGPLANF